jgi:beta-fructofuranosidase
MLQLRDKWVWDFWFAYDGGDYHVFYLQAPRALGDPGARHRNATIGHAVSTDLRTWTLLPDALGPGATGQWDDLATWTGSIIERNGVWWMFYTGISTVDDGRIQRIGLATSTDLIHWTKEDANPLLRADPRWYERYDPEVWHEEAWRDPWVFHNPATDDYRMFICARANRGPGNGRGVVGHARSDDLRSWEALAPVTRAGEFGHLEVPQLVEIDEIWYLVFSVYEWAHADARLQRTPAVAGTHYMTADDPLGPFTTLTDEFLAGDRHGSRYAGKLLRDPDGRLVYMAFSQYPDGHGTDFRGDLSDPMPVRVRDDGRLVIDDS